MAGELRSTFQWDAFREGIWTHELSAIHDCSILSFIPGTWCAEGRATEDGLGGTALVLRVEGED